MEQVTDKVITELEALVATTSAYGGISDFITIDVIYFGDPGIIPAVNYPCFVVQPMRDTPLRETTGYEVRELELLVQLLIDARTFFDADVDEANGDRVLVQAMEKVRAWFRRIDTRNLDGLAQTVKVTSAEYMVQQRDTVIAKSAQVTLVVHRNFPRVL